MNIEVRESVPDREAFRSFWATQSQALTHEAVAQAVRHCISNGVTTPVFGAVPPEAISLNGSNFRESLRVQGLNSRQRAVLELLLEEWGIDQALRIYAPEATTALALRLRSQFPRFLGSEFAATQEEADRLYPIPVEDLQQLSLKSDSFDVVLTCDVLEHVPDIRGSLTEMYRVLRPGGIMYSTFPFTWKYESRVQARLVGGQVVHLTTPEFHGNPISGDGSLVFTVPGWEILDWTREVGFDSVEMVLMASTTLAVFGSDPPLINILRCVKPGEASNSQ